MKNTFEIAIGSAVDVEKIFMRTSRKTSRVICAIKYITQDALMDMILNYLMSHAVVHLFSVNVATCLFLQNNIMQVFVLYARSGIILLNAFHLTNHALMSRLRRLGMQ